MAKSRRQLMFTSSIDETPSTCTLCFAPHTQMSVPKVWRDVQAQEIAYTQLHLTKESRVCRLCRDDISKLLINPASTPRWEKMGRKENCCIHMCINVAFVKTRVATTEQVAVNTRLQECPIPHAHYHTLYNTLQSQQIHYYTCNHSLRNSQTRMCPNTNNT